MNDTHTPGIGGIAASILDDAPPPQEHAIESAASEVVLELPPLQDVAPVDAMRAVLGALDDGGEAWNPEIHATGADGAGVKTAKGLWRKRRGIGTSRVGAPSQRAGAPVASVDDTQSRAAGTACAHTVFMMGRVIGGEEWAPRIDAERNEVAMMEKAWGDYFVAKGYTEFPPGIALSMALTAYAAPRFTMPVTQSRAVKFKQWAVGKYIGWKAKRENKRAATKDLDAAK
jgi:hypothetical protein